MENTSDVDAAPVQPIVSQLWECVYYQSGTMIVRDTSQPTEPFKYGEGDTRPHFYIYGPGGTDDDDGTRNRYKVCDDVRDYMNGGERPKWLDDLTRVSEERAEDLDGTSITATGPMVDSDPPKCFWVQDDSDEAKNARARLMDRLLFAD